jgi:hypothetical protein
LAEVPTPQPGPGQILMKMRAAGMNPMDRTLASGDWQPAPATFPMVLGADGEGVVESVGEGTKRFSRGDDLFGQLLIAPIGSAGTYADYVVVTEDAPLARVPDGLDPVLAAALPTSGGSALALVELLEPLNGKTVLIVGAGGGVGSFSTQLAANAGGRVIANGARPQRSACAVTALPRPSITRRSRCRTRYDRRIRMASMRSWTWSARRKPFPGSPRSSARGHCRHDAIRRRCRRTRGRRSHRNQLRVPGLDRAPRAAGGRSRFRADPCAADHADRARGGARRLEPGAAPPR